MNRIILAIFLTLFWVFTATSQSFEMRLTNLGSGNIGVQMRAIAAPAPTTANLLTDLVFGICWDNGYGVNLSTVSTTYDISKAGVETVNGSTRYQLFAKNPNPTAFPQNWVINEWVTIMTIGNSKNSLQSTGTFALCPTNIQELNINYDLNEYPVTAAGSALGVQISATLPVELVSFTAQAKSNKEIGVNWKTQAEINLSHYEIEYATDGLKFSNIHQTKATKALNYQFVHKNPVMGINYYRLKMVDIDGSFRYSQILSVDFKKNDFDVKVFPNPVSRAQSITFATALEETFEVHIYAIDGKEVYHDVFDKEVNIPIKNWQSGTYIYKITNPNGRYKQDRFIVH